MFTRNPTYSPTAISPLFTAHSSQSEIFAFSAKERDTETGYSYFGSRYYNSDLSIWLSVDPMSDKYPSLSPYAYCANNPMRLVDPNGEEFGDYFNEFGKYLGTDCIDDGEIHIVKDAFWNAAKDNVSWESNDGTRIISQEVGNLFSKKPSESNLTDKAIQNIVGHYNNTGLKLLLGNKGALDTEFSPNGSYYTVKLTINIKKWKETNFINNYNDIISSFDHEIGHMKQCKIIGFDSFYRLSKYQREKYAVDYQTSQPVFSKTSKSFQKWVPEYLQSFIGK